MINYDYEFLGTGFRKNAKVHQNIYKYENQLYNII